MACPPLMKSIARNPLVRFPSSLCSELDISISSRSSGTLQKSGTALGGRRLRLYCKAENGGKRSNGEEPPESLFTKELRKRGITPTSLLEEDKIHSQEGVETNLREEDGGRSSSSSGDMNSSKQLEISRSLNSEGLEGLIPRAKLLLRFGATFFLGFWPLVIITVASFCALYLYFGMEFIHDGSLTPLQYVDPYAFL